MTQIRVELPEALTRMPVKAFLTQKEGISSTQWKRIKHSGTFRVNGILCNAARTEVRSGDIITFDIVRPSDIEPEDLPLDIRYEDDYLMVVNKPAGQLVHPTTKRRTARSATLYYIGTERTASTTPTIPCTGSTATHPASSSSPRSRRFSTS